MAREHLFSVTRKDFEIETFRCGGAGGQHRDKTSNGVRIRHRESGAVGECTQFREQSANKKAAFNRLVKSSLFQSWVNEAVIASRLDRDELERRVDAAMDESNLLIEYGKE